MDSVDEESPADVQRDDGVKRRLSSLQHLHRRQQKLLDEVLMLAKRSQVFQESLAPDVPKERIANQDIYEKIMLDCDQVWKGVNEMQARICMQEAPPVNVQNPILDILLAKKCLLEAEVDISKETKPLMPLKYPECALVVGEEKLKQVITQLEETLSFYRNTIKTLKSEVAREWAYVEDQKKIRKALEDKLAQLSLENTKMSSSQDLSKEMQERLHNAMVFYKKLKKALLMVSDEFFGVPKKSDVRSKRQKISTSANRSQNTEYIGIHNILELLIDQMITCPHDPYVIVQDDFWPPFVELLIRFDIAVVHPEDHRKIRVQSYHE